MTVQANLAVRDWDYLTPLLLNELPSSNVNLTVTRVNTLVDDWSQHPEFDGGEMSLSRYSQLKAKGDDTLIGIPHFLMRGFRQRCILTRKSSDFRSLQSLKKVGLTGWQDSGNIWTRAIFRQAGIEMSDVHWFVGRLTEQHPIVDRLAGFGLPGMIDNCRDDLPMVELLENGELDAICTPFMPAGFFDSDSKLRPVFENYQQIERTYVDQQGYVPGIHILVLKRQFVEQNPGIGRVLSQLFDDSYQLWMDKRTKYADTTPWLLDDISRMHRELPSDWNDQGVSANHKMLSDWCVEIFQQGIVREPITIDMLFSQESW